MPESPKFLMETGRETEAFSVFQKMFKLNNRCATKPFPAAGLIVRSRDDGVKNRPTSSSRCQRLGHQLKQALGLMKQLFVGALASRSVVLLFLFFCISFGFYGLWLWFPEFSKRAEDGGSRVQSSENESCCPVQTAVYMEGFVTAASNLPGNIFTILLMDRIGWKILLSVSLLVFNRSVFVIYMVNWTCWELNFIPHNYVVSLLLHLFFSHLSDLSEHFAVQCSSALGVFTGVGRVVAIMGNVVFWQLVDSYCAVPALLLLYDCLKLNRLNSRDTNTHLVD